MGVKLLKRVIANKLAELIFKYADKPIKVGGKTVEFYPDSITVKRATADGYAYEAGLTLHNENVNGYNSPGILFEFDYNPNLKALILQQAGEMLAFMLSDDGGSSWQSGLTVKKNEVATRHLLPLGTEQYDIGSSSQKFRNMYLSGKAVLDAIKLAERTSDPALEKGLLWFRSDEGKLYYSPDGSKKLEVGFVGKLTRAKVVLPTKRIIPKVWLQIEGRGTPYSVNEPYRDIPVLLLMEWSEGNVTRSETLSFCTLIGNSSGEQTPPPAFIFITTNSEWSTDYPVGDLIFLIEDTSQKNYFFGLNTSVANESKIRAGKLFYVYDGMTMYAVLNDTIFGHKILSYPDYFNHDLTPDKVHIGKEYNADKDTEDYKTDSQITGILAYGNNVVKGEQPSGSKLLTILYLRDIHLYADGEYQADPNQTWETAKAQIQNESFDIIAVGGDVATGREVQDEATAEDVVNSVFGWFEQQGYDYILAIGNHDRGSDYLLDALKSWFNFTTYLNYTKTVNGFKIAAIDWGQNALHGRYPVCVYEFLYAEKPDILVAHVPPLACGYTADDAALLAKACFDCEILIGLYAHCHEQDYTIIHPRTIQMFGRILVGPNTNGWGLPSGYTLVDVYDDGVVKTIKDLNGNVIRTEYYKILDAKEM